MLATVVWVGGLALMALVVWPSMHAMQTQQPVLVEFLHTIQKRFAPFAWGSLAVLIATGLTQMTASPQYHGVLRIENTWSMAILVKHIAIGGMIAIGVYMQLMLQPALDRVALLESKKRPAPEAAALRQREGRLILLNLLCGFLVLAFTAIARVVP
jgi:uncharacterized membrane protein